MRGWRDVVGLLVLGLLVQLSAAPRTFAQQQRQSAAAAGNPVRIFTIPQVAGASIDQARTALKSAGFDGRPAPNQSADEGSRVERTVPPAGTSYRSDERRPVVELVLRIEPPRRVPSIIRQTCDEAANTLRAGKLRLGRCDVGAITGRVDAQRIHTQRPAADAPIDPRGTLTVDAIVEPPSVLVPNVTDRSAPEAITRLGQDRLRARPSIVPPQRWHRVAAQQPEAGQRVAPSTEVRIDLVYVVPALQGLRCDEARRRVVDAGHRDLDCRVETVTAPRGEDGRIFRQAPAADSTVREPVTVQAFTPLVRTPVPALVGMTEDAARRELNQVRLSAREKGPPAAEGRRVALQSPERGRLVAPGSIVDVDFALTVPDLRGASCDAARTLASRHGFDIFECGRRVTSPAAPLGRVFEQSPAARTQLALAAPINATVAQGITVPKVTGLDPRAAITRVRVAGLEGRADSVDGDRIVVRQQPQADAEVAPATRVDLATQRMTQVPDVVGRTLEQALPIIAGRELRARSDAGDAPAMRRVRAQQPTAQTRAAVGATVALTTVLEAIVPNVVDMTLDAAQARVEGAGLRAQAESTPRSGPKIVRRQQPAAGARVDAASAVTLHAVTRVQVPEVRQQSCEQAQQAARTAGLEAPECLVEGPLGITIGTPIVRMQSLEAGRTVDEGELLRLEARTPLAPVVGIGAGLAAMLGAGVLFIRRTHKPPPPAPPPPTLELRIVADLTPQVAIRAPQDLDRDDHRVDHRDDHRVDPRDFEANLHVRIVVAEPTVTIRAWAPTDHDDRDPG